MTDEPQANAGPPPTADPQDPLPEGSFFYRRVFSYVLSICIIALLALVIWRIDGADELRRVALYLCLLLFMIVTYYMIAPSAEQVVKMLQTAKLFAKGITMRQTATAESPSGRATTQTTVEPARPRPPRSGSDFDAAPTSRR